MLGSLPALALAASVVVSGVHGEPVEEELDKVELFTGVGKSSAYQNTWGGWYSDKLEYRVEVENGDGKREAYDSTPLEVLIFSDVCGREIEYRLEKRFQGKTLLEIVQHCMGNDRVNMLSNLWESGHCTIGHLTRPFSGPQLMDPFATVSEHLRIGVGDGMGDPTDWCVFMPEEGNSGGDFAGLNAFCFGSEDETNTGCPGKVTIQGGVKKAPASPWPDAAPAEGNSKAVVAAVVVLSVFLTACPFICASLWCFCRPNREGGGSNNTSKAGKKGVSGVDAESDIISMIEEMGDAPAPLTAHSPVCVTLSNGSDTPASPSSWRVK